MSESSPTGGFPLPAGFSVAGLHCGIKSNPESPDLSLFVSDREAVSAGVFTKNLVVGAPVTWSRRWVGSTGSRGIIINSGNANACTGSRGMDDAKWMAGTIGELLGCAAEAVLVCSTGIIGRPLDRTPLASGMAAITGQLGDNAHSVTAAARGMMTTDIVPKLAARSVPLSGGTVRITGFAKGAAMIAPNMATMLGVILTDLTLSPNDSHTLLTHATDRSFNAISVDGHTSTSDSVLLLANGASLVSLDSDDDRERFAEALTDLCVDLAGQIIRDAEGAEHFVTVNVTGCETRDAAARIAKVVSESALVKTAITGNDPNWGRIVSAAGYANVPFDPAGVSLDINGVRVFTDGHPIEFAESELSASMAEGEVTVDLRIGTGEGAATFWTTDLTSEYVRLNSEYTT